VTQPTLFNVEPSWKEYWWGMPHFSMNECRPQHSIVVNFLTVDDVKEFARITGIPVTTQSDSAWFPHQRPITGRFEYRGPKTPSRYPICIPSKGRAQLETTSKQLDILGVTDYRFFVEETEAREYIARLGEQRVVVMPFHDLGQGSIPARNFIWEWAVARAVKRHWTVDDNISAFARCDENRRLNVRGGGFFRAMEDFVDRFENVAMAGPHHKGFVLDRDPGISPYLLNSRVYSCILLDTTLPDRWRGRYNEDTDLSLRLLKQGWVTLLFRSLLMDKGDTVGSKNSRPLPGGNTTHVYNQNDHRRRFAESLRDQHPDCVEVVWKFNRWHHQVDYSRFTQRLRLRQDIVARVGDDDYGMTLYDSKDQEIC
jgi:hypothetical protein